MVEGHEFDGYPKKMMPDIQNWNWFVEEEGRDGEGDDGKKGKGRERGEEGIMMMSGAAKVKMRRC